ncbi:hypothetical protein BGX30_005634 [Mortierella sp. GBA39]|nr:hypothetical protein BGX30_005634 [Mortierella sp. GBA39]
MANVLDSFKTVVTSNGKVYGAPVGSTNAGGILYNKKVYADLGLSVPKTWDEFMAINEKIKAAGKTAVLASYKDTWTSQLFVLADFYNVQAQVPNFAADYTANKVKYATTPAALRGFEKIEEVYKKGYMNKDFLATTYDVALKMLATGEGVHYPMLSSGLDTIMANTPDQIDDIGFFAQPSDSADVNGLTIWMPSGLYINKDTKNADAAKKWVDYFVSPEGQAVFASKVKAAGPYVIKGATLPDDSYGAVKDMQHYFDEGHTAPALEFVSPVKGPNLENITVAVGSGISTGKKGAEDYDKDVEKQAQQLNLPGCTIAVGIAFSTMMHPSHGMFNTVLASLGITGPDWLGNTKIALLSVAMVDVWKGVGVATVIYIAGISAIPQEYYEALKIDGGNNYSAFWNITLPLSRPAMNSVIILAFGGLRSFDLIWAMTKGGPGFTTDLIASIIYKQYQAGFYGLATAGNVILFIAVSVLAFPLYKFLTKSEVNL